MNDPVENMSENNLETKKRSNTTLWVMFFLFGLPYLAAYYYYFNRDQIDLNLTTNHGHIINPTKNIPDILLSNINGSMVEMSSIKGKWLLLTVGSSRCEKACQDNLYKIRQIKKGIGEEQDRIHKLFFLTDTNKLDSFIGLLKDYKGMDVFKPFGDSYSEFLSIFSIDGKKVEDGIYIIDPMGNYMMMYPKDEPPMNILKDIERLLKVSKIG